MEAEHARRRFASRPLARLATVRPDGSPHLVPVTFAVDGDTIYTAVDAKPKRSRRLQRLVNLSNEPRCTLLVDHYEDDWSGLWWVRADGRAELLDAPAADGLALLAEKYAQYAAASPDGPMIAVRVLRWTGWSAT